MNQAELSVFKRIGLTLPEKAQLEKDLEKMWAPFEQMDREYVEIVRTFHQKFLNPNFTQQYKNELRATAKNDIKGAAAEVCCPGQGNPCQDSRGFAAQGGKGAKDRHGPAC